MLKYTIVCVMLVAAAAMGWGQLDDVPVNVESGAHLTWGDGLVWGMFPIQGGQGGAGQKTYALKFNPNAEPDSMWDDSTIPLISSRRLFYAGLTFQWNEQPVVWACGWHEDGGNEYSKLYWYPVDSAPNEWREATIDSFTLGNGASIAYDPERASWAVNCEVPGWIYCLPGDGTTFWRYAIPGGVYVPDMEAYGYYPGPGAIIADQTPHFRWNSAATTQYRIQVSANQYFMSNVIDEVLSSPEYEPTAELANGTYYWRTATWTAGTWSWCVSNRSFSLEGGWQRLADIPEAVTQGAMIAYDKGIFDGGSRSILALPGGGQNQHHRVHSYRYNITQNSWVQLDSVYDVTEHEGTSLTTRTPTPEAASPLVRARFTNSGDVPYGFTQNDGWNEWCVESGDTMKDSHFPGAIGPYSSMVIGGDNYMYLLKGFAEQFYYVELPVDGDGGQASGVVRNGKATAHVITSHGGVEVEYELPASAHVRVTVHDAVGRQVGYLDAGDQQRGVHRVNWDRDSEGRRLSAGAYFVLLDIGTEQTRLKAVVE